MPALTRRTGAGMAMALPPESIEVPLSEQPTSRLRVIIDEAANAFDSDIARTLIELAEELEAEAADEQPRVEPVIRAT